MIRRAEAADHPWIIATGAEAYRDLGDYTRILPSWLEQPGVLARSGSRRRAGAGPCASPSPRATSGRSASTHATASASSTAAPPTTAASAPCGWRGRSSSRNDDGPAVARPRRALGLGL